MRVIEIFGGEGGVDHCGKIGCGLGAGKSFAVGMRLREPFQLFLKKTLYIVC